MTPVVLQAFKIIFLLFKYFTDLHINHLQYHVETTYIGWHSEVCLTVLTFTQLYQPDIWSMSVLRLHSEHVNSIFVPHIVLKKQEISHLSLLGHQ